MNTPTLSSIVSLYEEKKKKKKKKKNKFSTSRMFTTFVTASIKSNDEISVSVCLVAFFFYSG